MRVIEVENLKKTYEYYKKQQGLKGSLKNLFKREKLSKDAVNAISFSVNEGDVVGFVGLNGAGKSTTIKMLSGILEPTSGKISVLGETPFDKRNSFLKQITVVMGNKSQLWWDIPAIETFDLNRRIYGVDKERYNKLMKDLVNRLNVEELLNVQVRKLSLGERMKMELIAALIHSPSVLFLDEPTIGLDIISQETIRTFIKEINKKYNTTIILTSHNFDDIAQSCNKLILIDKGSLIYDDTYGNFISEYANDKTITVKFNSPIDYSLDVKLFKNADFDNSETVKIKVDSKDVVDISQYIMNNYAGRIADITVENINVESVIKDFYVRRSEGCRKL